VFGGKLYAFGGRDEHTMLLNDAEIYDPAADSWAALVPLPTGRSGIGAAVSGARIVVFGGQVAGVGAHTFNNAEAYDPATHSWDALTPMPTARHGLGVAAVGNNIYVVAGGPQPGLTVSDVNEELCGLSGG
jgi:N-acetylneuraminic acid mutarotase